MHNMVEIIFVLLVCHFLGDYVLQTDFLARTKGGNLWHMIAHCVLYTMPFYCVFGLGWHILALFISHFITDISKARWHTISYLQDQFIHITILAFMVMGGIYL